MPDYRDAIGTGVNALSERQSTWRRRNALTTTDAELKLKAKRGNHQGEQPTGERIKHACDQRDAKRVVQKPEGQVLLHVGNGRLINHRIPPETDGMPQRNVQSKTTAPSEWS